MSEKHFFRRWRISQKFKDRLIIFYTVYFLSGYVWSLTARLHKWKKTFHKYLGKIRNYLDYGHM